MLTEEYIDRLQSITSPGGIITDENRFDRSYLLNVLNTFRAVAIQEAYRKDRRVAAVTYQEFIVYRDTDYEASCPGRFPIPNIVSIGTDKSGFDFIGSMCGTYTFNLVLDRATNVSNSQNRLLKKFAQDRNVLYVPSESILEVYNPDVEQLKVSASVFNPTLVPSFDYYVNDYPMDEGLWENIEDMLKRGWARLGQIKPDRISNGAEDFTINPQIGK